MNSSACLFCDDGGKHVYVSGGKINDYSLDELYLAVVACGAKGFLHVKAKQRRGRRRFVI
jgi:hypothetical protein